MQPWAEEIYLTYTGITNASTAELNELFHKIISNFGQHDNRKLKATGIIIGFTKYVFDALYTTPQGLEERLLGIVVFIIHPCDATVVIYYLIWPCDIAVHITFLISHSSSLW